MTDDTTNQAESPTDQGRVGCDAEPPGVATEARPAPSIEAMYRQSWKFWQELRDADERDGR